MFILPVSIYSPLPQPFEPLHAHRNIQNLHNPAARAIKLRPRDPPALPYLLEDAFAYIEELSDKLVTVIAIIGVMEGEGHEIVLSSFY